MTATSEPTWTNAAASLAQRVERRARLGAFVWALGAGLAAGAVLALGARLSGHAGLAAPLVLAGGLIGLIAGTLRARRVEPVGSGDAAWALDRLAGAHEHGLTVAVLGSERASADGEPPPAPPHVRLRPPAGLSLLAGGGVLAALALVIGASGEAAPGAPEGEGAERVVAHVTGPATGTDAGPSAARQAEERALEAERVRRALGLTAAESQDPAAVAERLKDPEARAAARAAAQPDGALAAALAGEKPTNDAVAEGLRSGARAAEAVEGLRRAELSREAAPVGPSVPAAKRALVERYFALRTSGGR